MFNSTVNKFLFKLIKDRPIYILASLAFSLSTAVFGAVGTIFLIPIVMMIFGNSQEIIFPTPSPIINYIFAFCNSVDRNDRLPIIITISAIAFIFRSLASYGNQLIGITQTKHLTYRMRALGFGSLCQADIDYYERHKVGDLLFTLNREIDKTALFVKGIQKVVFDSIDLIFLSFVLLLISVPLSLIAFSAIAIGALANYFLITYTKKPIGLSSQKSKDYTRLAIDFLTGIRYIKTTASEHEQYATIVRSIQEKNSTQLKAQLVSSLLQPLNEITTILTVLVLIIAHYYLYSDRAEYIPILFIHLAILFRLLPILSQLNNTRIQIINNQASVEIVAYFLDRVSKPAIISGQTKFTKLKTSIKFQNVSFAYPRHPHIVLNKINIQILKGQTIALVGSSGAGKSTLASLLSRLYDPIEGKIEIDERDLKTYNLISLRQRISVVTQDAFLFNNSLRYNLTHALKNVSDDEIIFAAKQTNLFDFIERQPQGLDTNINDIATTITEQQKQLIAITRAFLCNPEIVILDIAAENLAEGDREIIQNALNKLCRDRTTIVISDRAATIEKADKIIILNKGKIIESGTHQELLKNGTAYRQMCSARFKTSQQSHQQKLARKISQRLARQTNNNLSFEIRNNLNTLLNYLQLVNNGLIEDNDEQDKILDESYQSAKNMLASLREYEQKISKVFRRDN